MGISCSRFLRDCFGGFGDGVNNKPREQSPPKSYQQSHFQHFQHFYNTPQTNPIDIPKSEPYTRPPPYNPNYMYVSKNENNFNWR